MAVFVLISGSNNSGKSRYAEQLIAQTTGDRYYIATMRPYTEENHRRIEKHRAQRKNLKFETLELPYRVGNATVTAGSVVLLEDVSNLLANAIFEKNECLDNVLEDICKLLDRCRILVAVTISGLKNDGYDAETETYIDSLNALNEKLFERATVAITMQDRTPTYQKGDIHDLL